MKASCLYWLYDESSITSLKPSGQPGTHLPTAERCRYKLSLKGVAQVLPPSGYIPLYVNGLELKKVVVMGPPSFSAEIFNTTLYWTQSCWEPDSRDEPHEKPSGQAGFEFDCWWWWNAFPGNLQRLAVLPSSWLVCSRSKTCLVHEADIYVLYR